MKRQIIISVILVATALTFSACKETDVVGKVSITSFEAVLNTKPNSIQYDESYNGWALTSPTGERFIWSKDFSIDGNPDAVLEFDAKPFLDAGLDLSKLPTEMIADDKIVYLSEIGADNFTYKGDATPLASYKQIVDTNRETIGYHAALDHYGITLGNGNMFEWAKDLETNDKDIVFVLNPQPFIEAGADPEKIEGWVFAKVEMMDENGKPMEVDKLLKPFDLQ